ncbi:MULTISPECIES: type II secretion system F family protein [unclassified Nesterenkonia]|uniref:type II secretion system F family protein n=1 Tax=unclassified Nesterenkonia TaxID=2629769 RepID=UPI001F4CF647|nr:MULTISPECIES: type II secretion system F family protein [unclassified Nesterenkonia]MCH8560946.1 type II secretion system F family protein [Nesterenkonia sp. DZ6]MCH8571026.1 type II secretion system F family protein [Nesterenkonia sp. AY15]
MMEIILENLLPTIGVLAGAIAVGIISYLMVSPGPVRVPVERRQPGHVPMPSALERGAGTATALVERLIHRRGTPVGASTLELAAVKLRPQDFVFLVIVGSVVGFALGLVLSGALAAFLFAAAVPLGAKILLGLRISKRQKQFADQLDDSLQLMASNLRAGHSLPQALSSVAKEAESPTSDEFVRIVNETRVGRDLGVALDMTAARMASEDFSWITQAIAINREVGGNLAEVLDGVANTIRQRNDIKRQVATLSAEGRLSALILMVLPFGLAGFLLMSNPGYLAPFTESALGYGLMILGVVMLTLGGLWLRKVVEIKF